MIQPEHIRRKWVNDYAKLQILKLKVCIFLFLLVWWLR